MIKELPGFSVPDNRKTNKFLNKCSPRVPFLLSQHLLSTASCAHMTSFFQRSLSLIKPFSTHAPERSVSQVFPGVQRFEMPGREMHCKYCNYYSCRRCEFSTTRKPVQNKLLDRGSLWPESQLLFLHDWERWSFCTSAFPWADQADGLCAIPTDLGANSLTYGH